MKSRRFFHVVWRIDAILILIAGLFAVCMSIYVGWEIFRDISRPRHDENVVNVGDTQIDRSKGSLGDFQEIRGHNILRAELRFKQDYEERMSFKEGNSSSIKNYLFYDPVSDKTYWLFPNNNNRSLILSDLNISENHDAEPNKPPILAVVYEIIESDTNEDKKIDEHDDRTIAISDPLGLHFSKLLTNVKNQQGHKLIEQSELVILYTDSNSLRAARVNLQNYKITSNVALKTGALIR